MFLSCGRAPWLPRRIGDHDLVWWAVETGFLDQPVGALPTPMARLFANIARARGRDGGHDLDLRTLRTQGVTLLGRFTAAAAGEAQFASDLYESSAWGDQRYRDFRQLVRDLAAARGVDGAGAAGARVLRRQRAREHRARGRRRGRSSPAATGPTTRTWLHVRGAFDPLGFPVHEEGASTAAPGLYFVGVHFLRKRKSSLFWGVGEDAAIVAGQIASTRGG